MIINSTGIKKSDLTDYLGFWTEKLREQFGNDFVIKKEGVVDNIATAGSLTCMALEDVMLYLAKNMNPYTAEGEWQDALYSLVGLTRRFASYTTITRTISGLENQVCEVGSIRFKNSATDDIFELNTEVTLDANGVGVGSFTAIELGAIELESTATLEIVDAPEGVEAVYYSSGNITTVGDDFEDDSEFRLRWIATNSVKSSNTEGGMRKVLLPLCDNEPKNIIIRQNRSTRDYLDLDLHTMNIVLKSAESNETIAETILENLVDGLGLDGTTTVTLQDSENNDIDISFTKGEDLPIKFYIEVVLLNGTTITNVTKNIKDAIINHLDYGLGERIIANDFYQYINAVDGVDYVTSLEIKAPGEEPSQTITVDFDKYAEISADNIYVTEAE
ncbi:MAG: baseplate J/gp47 family protein [Clostridia bacterium]|nr:baseplate J/gp47 family protein [Clostridia bacterium]